LGCLHSDDEDDDDGGVHIVLDQVGLVQCGHLRHHHHHHHYVNHPDDDRGVHIVLDQQTCVVYLVMMMIMMTEVSTLY
jgi:hypothetical protein